MADDPRLLLRRAELLGVLSLATDVGIGQPMQYGLRTAIVAQRFAACLGLGPAAALEARDVALLRWIGCTSHAHELSGWFGDELAARSRLVGQDLLAVIRPLWEILQHVGSAMEAGVDSPEATGRALGSMLGSGAEVAGGLAAALGFSTDVRLALSCAFERWDGAGPRSVAGAGLPMSLQIAQIVQDAEVFRGSAGLAAASSVIAKRAGSAYDPELAAWFAARAEDLVAGLDEISPWDQVMREEPQPWATYAEEAVDGALAAVADFVDLKSPYTLGHSRRVAAVAAAAAGRCGFGAEAVTLLRRAGLVHDLGMVEVPNNVWGKPGPLTEGDRERVRLHPYRTERMLARSAFLAPIGRLAGLHHERLDGSGYPHGIGGATLGRSAQVLAAAEVWVALREPRPYRKALGAAAAEKVLLEHAHDGRLLRDAVDAVLGAGPGRRHGVPTPLPDQLSAREIGVLRLLASGSSNREIAARLSISEKTVSRHLENVYRKAGVRSRAAATLYALRHDLLG